MKWKILISDGLEENGLLELSQVASVDLRENLPMEELSQIIDVYDGLIVRSRTKVTDQILGHASKLKVVGRAGVGVDNIDLEAAKHHGVVVVNTPTSTSIAVAELTIGLMLALARSLPLADSCMKNGAWIKNQLQGFELYGKTLGVIGMGNIGMAVTERAKAFGLSVIGFDLLLGEAEIRRRGANPLPIEEIYASSDILTLHVPLTDQTTGLIDNKSIDLMKPGMIIVCTSRGGIINESALLAGLNSGKVGGAALDVFLQEPPGETLLVKHPKLIATPHIGAQTKESQERAARDIAQEVLTVLRKEQPRWRVA